MTEWQAWAYLAMLWDHRNSLTAGICVSIEDYIPVRLQERMHRRAEFHRPKGSAQKWGSFYWQPWQVPPRVAFCWKMAELCEKEGLT